MHRTQRKFCLISFARVVTITCAMRGNRSMGLTGPRRDRHIDIASDRIRVRADRMSTLDEPFSGLFVDASHGYGKCGGGQHEGSCFVSTEVDSGDDVAAKR
jgi:hypothetical protein